jgi:hypothetical protein
MTRTRPTSTRISFCEHERRAGFICQRSCDVFGSAKKKTAKPSRTSPFLLKRFDMRTKVIRIATALERPSVGHGRARDN